MKSCTFGVHLLLVRGSCLVLRLNSLLFVSEPERTSLTRAGAGARTAAGLSGIALGPKAGGQQWDRRRGPAVALSRGWTGDPAQLWSGDDEVGGDEEDDEWLDSSTRHRAHATTPSPAVRSPFSPPMRSLAPAALPGVETDRPHGSGGGSERAAPLVAHSCWQRLWGDLGGRGAAFGVKEAAQNRC